MGILGFDSPYLEGQGDLVSRLKRGISRDTIWVIGLISLLSPPDPPSSGASRRKPGTGRLPGGFSVTCDRGRWRRDDGVKHKP